MALPANLLIRRFLNLEPQSLVPDCKACRYSFGKCYDQNNDGSPDGCECPAYRKPSDPGAWTTKGCDVGIGKAIFRNIHFPLHPNRRYRYGQVYAAAWRYGSMWAIAVMFA
jgi:hypothetical protein